MSSQVPLYTTLIDTNKLLEHLDDPAWLVVDCRFDLKDTSRSRREYLQAHIPGAAYADLDVDLSSPKIPGLTGRHPLPSIEDTAGFFSRLGIASGVQIVAYDDAGGALAAGRLWWILRWLGHQSVAVLDGGWQRWLLEVGETRTGHEERSPAHFLPMPHPDLLVTTGQVEDLRHDPTYRLLDARSSERFHGRNETIDPIAGHIPGAISAPYAANLTPEGLFKPVDALRQHYETLLAEVLPVRAVVYCGSGVSAIHSILAMEHAGLYGSRLYAGSWSEWIANPSRPVAVGK